jgi:hypothetical protein
VEQRLLEWREWKDDQLFQVFWTWLGYVANEPAVLKLETMRRTGETPLEDLPRKTRSYLALLRERSLILPGICEAILGQG